MTSPVKCAPLGIAVLLAVFAAADACAGGGGCLRWTPWINADKNAGDGGDFETIGFDVENGRAGRVTQELARRGIVCNNPVQVECREASSYRRKWHLTGDDTQTGYARCTLNEGFTCTDKYQKDGKCHDYEIRLLCWTDTCEQLTWTPWYDNDNPSGHCDCETRDNRAPGCPDGRTPLDIDCRTTRDQHAALTKDLKVVCNVNEGSYCFNRNQPGYVQGSWRPLCLDYRVRYLCGAPYSEPVKPEVNVVTIGHKLLPELRERVIRIVEKPIGTVQIVEAKKTG